MSPEHFEEANLKLGSSTRTQYSDKVPGIEPLYAWSDGERCVSRWRMTWRERIAALLWGRVWIASLSGRSQPPIYAVATKTYFTRIKTQEATP